MQGRSPWMHELAGRAAKPAEHTDPANELLGSAR